MKEKITLFAFFILIIISPLQLYAKEAKFSDRSSPINAVEKSKKQTEIIYENVFKNIFNFNSNITNTPSAQYPTSTPNPENSTPTPTGSAPDSWTPDITDLGIFSQVTLNGAKSCLKNQAVYRRVEQETGLSWQIVAGVHFVEGSCGSTSSCYSGRIFGEFELDMGNSCTPHARKVAGGCVFDNLLDSCIDGARHYIDNFGKIPRTAPEVAAASRIYNGTGNDNCQPGRTPYKWCPAEFPGADHTHSMTWFDGDLICKQNPNAKYCLYKIYCSDGEGGECAYGTRQLRLGSVTVAKILGLDL
ncbi:MAG: hypothetical protein Q8P72_03960 [Candidatus Roizmanbacteria bacterium]|nr:hypothetical protein [Candidatus Roizmanbacteria bacterium]